MNLEKDLQNCESYINLIMGFRTMQGFQKIYINPAKDFTKL